MKRAVVIGSGAGGLASAVLLAKRGWAVTVLEQHTRAGGFLHRFFRGGVGYDTGFHYIGSADKGQLVWRILGHLGVRDRLTVRSLDTEGFDRIRFPGLEFRVPVGVDRFAERLVSTFPHEAVGIARYIELHKAAAAAYGWYNLQLDLPVEEVLRVEGMSLRSVLNDCFQDERIRGIIAGQSALYGVPPRDAPFGVHAIVTDHFMQSAMTIEGGGDRLALELVRELRGLGGTIQFRARAERIEVQDGVAVAVHARVAGPSPGPSPGERSEGRTIRHEADLIIANAHPKHVLDLLPDGATRPAYRERVRDALPGRAHIGIYMRVRGDLSALASSNLYRFTSFSEDAIETPASPESVPFWFLTAPGMRDAAKPGQGAGGNVVLALIQGDWKQASACADDVGVPGDPARYQTPEYAEWKAALLARALEAFRADSPDWEILSAEASTPLTTWRYTGSPEGATYGHYHSVAQMGRCRLPIKVRVKNLLQVGHAVGFPGICGAMMTAYAAIGEIIGAEQLVTELKEVQ